MTMPEWSNELALKMLLALSIDETSSEKGYATLYNLFPRNKELGQTLLIPRKVLYSDTEDPMKSMKRAFQWMTTKRDTQKLLFVGEEWYDKSYNQKAKMNTMLNITSLLKHIQKEGTRGETIAKELDWYILVFDRAKTKPVTNELLLRVYLHIKKNGEKANSQYLETHLFSIGKRDDVLFGPSLRVPKKIIYSDKNHRTAMEKVVEFVTSSYVRQKELKNEAKKLSDSDAKRNSSALFSNHSTIKVAIDSVATGKDIASDVGLYLVPVEEIVLNGEDNDEESNKNDSMSFEFGDDQDSIPRSPVYLYELLGCAEFKDTWRDNML
jgi:hypothetical protein